MDDLERRRLTKQRIALLDEMNATLEAVHGAERADELVIDAETFLDWDIDYASGSLTLFDRDDIDEYLLEWCPRKLSFPPEEWLAVVDGLVAYLEFLGQSGHWRGPASTARALAAHARSRTEKFLAVMGDPSNYGMAKSLFMGPALAGADIDINDPQSLQAAIDRFNNLSKDERTALTDPFMSRPFPESYEAAERRARAAFDMPHVRLPAPEAVAASAASSPALVAVEKLRSHLGDKGVALTSTGNLKLADCRLLVEQLATGDTFDHGPPGATRQVRSMNELPNLAFIFDLAAEARAIRKAKGRLLPVKKWPAEPIAAATSLALIALDFHRIGMHPWIDSVEATLIGGVPYLLAPVIAFGVPVPMEEMMPLALSAIEEMPAPPWATPDSTARTVAARLKMLMRQLQLVGIVTLADEAVSATPFGVRLMVDHMRNLGFTVPELPSLASLGAEDLLQSIDDATVFAPEPAWAEWQPDWTDERRCRDLVDALISTPHERRTAHQRFAAFGLLKAAASSAAEPELHRLLGGPYAGYALVSLADHGLPVPSDEATTEAEMLAVSDLEAVMLPWVDQCYLDMTVDGPLAVVDSCRGLFDDTSAEAVLESLTRMPIAEAADVLAAIGKAYPHQATAKLARTAHHKWRSRWAR